ncbi:MAG: hypothetical protein QM764_11605 [Chitinophagaceae bacterium]
MENIPLHMSADPATRAYRVAFLICEFIKGTLDEKGISELDNWLKAGKENLDLFTELTNPANIRNEIQQRLN